MPSLNVGILTPNQSKTSSMKQFICKVPLENGTKKTVTVSVGDYADTFDVECAAWDACIKEAENEDEFPVVDGDISSRPKTPWDDLTHREDVEKLFDTLCDTDKVCVPAHLVEELASVCHFEGVRTAFVGTKCNRRGKTTHYEYELI